MAYQYIIFERSDGVGTVTLNRPEGLNSLTPQMLDELNDVFRGMERDPQVRAILITGAGKAFCGGEDFRQRAGAELSVGSSSNSGPAVAPQTAPTPTFEAFNPAFSLDDLDPPAFYNPGVLPGQTNPQPQLAAEFTPLSTGPQAVENPRTQPVPLGDSTNERPMPSFGSPGPSQPAEATPSVAEQIRRGYNPLIKQIRQIEKPVIAAVNGVAAGTGFGLALACDIRYAAERARFVEVSVRVGLLPGSGTGYFLPRLIGLSKALELAFQGEELSASEAERLGLVSRVVSGETLLEESRKLAVRLAKGPTRAIGLTKNLIYKSANLSLDQSLELEAQLSEDATRTGDYKEGLRAFVEKRAPNYRGQ